MKKRFLFIFLVFILLLISGCSKYTSPSCRVHMEEHYNQAVEYLKINYPSYSVSKESAEGAGPCNNNNIQSTKFDVLENSVVIGKLIVDGTTNKIELFIGDEFKSDKVDGNSVFNVFKNIFSNHVGKEVAINTLKDNVNSLDSISLILFEPFDALLVKPDDFEDYFDGYITANTGKAYIIFRPQGSKGRIIYLKRSDFPNLTGSAEDIKTRTIYLLPKINKQTGATQTCDLLVFYKDNTLNKKRFAGHFRLKSLSSQLNTKGNENMQSEEISNDDETNAIYSSDTIIFEPLNNVDLSSDSGYPGLYNVDVAHFTSESNNIWLRKEQPLDYYFNLNREDINVSEVWIAPLPNQHCEPIVYYQNHELYNRYWPAGKINLKAYPLLNESLFGNLYVDSYPTSANIRVDYEWRGLTPYFRNNSDIGYHYIRLEKPGYKVYSDNIYINSNQTTYLYVNLTPLQ